MFGLFKRPDNSAYWEAIANRSAENAKKWEQQASANWKRFTDALASNQRLTDALQAKNERLERIAEKFDGQSSGTAKLAVKLARGEA